MDIKDTLTKVAAILGTLAETNGSPESMLYIFCDMDMDKWLMLKSIMLKADFIREDHHYVTLTEEGRIKADAINQAIGDRS